MHDIARRQHGIITKSQLTDAGFDRRGIWRRCSSGVLEPVFPGVFRIAGAPRTWLQDVFAACAYGGGPPEGWPREAKAAASHRAAARLHGLNGFEKAEVEVTTVKQPRFDGAPFTAHQSRPDPAFLVLVEGIPVTNVARMLIDLAGVLATDELERTLDDALRQHKVNENWLRYAIDHMTGLGRRGAKALTALLDGRDPLDGPSASEFQKGLVRLVLDAGFPFVEEFKIPRLPYRADLGSEDNPVLVEGDSKKHHAGSQDFERDLRRRDEITAEGYSMLHFTPKDLAERPEWILAKIDKTLRSRGWPGPVAATPVSSGGARSRRG